MQDLSQEFYQLLTSLEQRKKIAAHLGNLDWPHSKKGKGDR